MNRLTAKLLLLVVLAGNIVPIALAANPAPAPACCLRKGLHHCQGSLGSETEPPVIHAPSCCRNKYRNAVTTTQWAHPHPRLAWFSLQANKARLVTSRSVASLTAGDEFHSPRAPPLS